MEKYFTHFVYIGKSRLPNEDGVATCGWCDMDTFESAQIRKIMEPTCTIALRSEDEARRLEKTIHRELDRQFGPRAMIWGGCTLRNGDKPNRSDEWWWCSPQEIQEIMFNITTGGLR